MNVYYNRLSDTEERIKLLKRLLLEHNSTRKILKELEEAKDERNDIIEEIRV